MKRSRIAVFEEPFRAKQMKHEKPGLCCSCDSGVCDENCPVHCPLSCPQCKSSSCKLSKCAIAKCKNLAWLCSASSHSGLCMHCFSEVQKHGVAIAQYIGAADHCQFCYQKLTPVRMQSSSNDDWRARLFHKACWLQIQAEEARAAPLVLQPKNKF